MAAQTAVVFSGRNGLDFNELRTGVLRIPDVTTRVREAQAILDTMDFPKIDLLNVISSDDDLFFKNIKLKSLASAIAQVGLFDRFLKTQRRPDFLVGNSNGDSAMLVAAGKITFEQLVTSSQALDTLKPSEKITAAADPKVTSIAILPAPLLSGISLTEYQAHQGAVGADGKIEFHAVREGMMDLKRIIASLHHESGVNRFVNIGPASALRGSDYKALGTDEIETLDSIELDPMLGWFWRGMRQPMALAQ